MFNPKIINKADISEKTKIMYNEKLRRLNKFMDKNNIKITHYRRLMNLIKKEWTNVGTQNNYLSAWKKYLELSGKSHLRIFKELSVLIPENIKKRDDLKNSKEKKKLKLTNEEYKNGIEKYKTKMSNKIENNKTIYEDEFLASFFLLLTPRRNDYYKMIIGDKDDDKHNLLIIKDDDIVMVFNDYKTKKKLGKQEIKIPNNTLIFEIIKRYTRKLALGDKIYSKVYSQFSKDFNNHNEELFGKRLGIIDNRKQFINLYKDEHKAVIKRLNELGHGLDTHIKYYMV